MSFGVRKSLSKPEFNFSHLVQPRNSISFENNLGSFEATNKTCSLYSPSSGYMTRKQELQIEFSTPFKSHLILIRPVVKNGPPIIN